MRIQPKIQAGIMRVPSSRVQSKLFSLRVGNNYG